MKILGCIIGYLGAAFFIMFSLWRILIGIAFNETFFCTAFVESFLSLFIGISIVIILMTLNLGKKASLHIIIILMLLDALILFFIPNCEYLLIKFCPNIVVSDTTANINNYKKFISDYLNASDYNPYASSCFILVSTSILCLIISKIKGDYHY